ncbi:MAG: phenylalanyl-tRNA synthetase beta chain, partial [Frankiaceae bacterium]|nr:phenylalanyl-tRNA synthetase beta chain [Frankiaceae bacterium]
AQTTNVLVESACFDPTSVARTARRLGLPSEASRRYERGVDPALAPYAAEVAIRMLTELGGASAESRGTDVDATSAPRPVSLPLTEAERLVGRPYPVEVQTDRLTSLGCTVTVGGGGGGDDGDTDMDLQVVPPTWRYDLERPADLVEEIARLEGYETIPIRLPRAVAGRGLTTPQRLRRRVADTLADAGFAEVMLLPFLAGDVADRLGLDADDPRRAAPRVANPLAEDERELRTTLLPGLLTATARNVGRGNADVALAEIGTVFRTRAGTHLTAAVPGVAGRPSDAELAALDDALPDQPRHVAVVLAGRREPAGWWGPGRAADWSDAVATAELLARTVGAPLEIAPAAVAPWHPGRCAELRLHTPGTVEVIGHAGELHPRVVAAWELPERTCALELDLDRLTAAVGPAVEVPPVSPYPAADRDVALVVAADVGASRVDAALRAGAGPLLESVALFDVYDQIGPGERSLAYRLRWRAPDRTLTAEQVNELRDASVGVAARQVGARLRA